MQNSLTIIIETQEEMFVYLKNKTKTVYLSHIYILQKLKINGYNFLPVIFKLTIKHNFYNDRKKLFHAT